MRKLLLFTFLFCALPQLMYAAGVDSLKVWRDSVNASYSFKTGEIVLKDGIAKIMVPKGYKYLDAKKSNQVLTDLWGNPPGDGSLGMLFPEASGPADAESWAIDVTYSEDGYIKDDDAKDINYTDLLEEMQADTESENEARVEQGYQPVELVGWAVAPFYDAASHKLHWAKELKFGEEEGVNTLNYNIRILGRKGYLMLNAIGDMNMLPGIKKDIPALLASVEFNDGNQYADFNPSLDKVASYGIGGLIAGKVLAKVGFFALFAKFFKVILLAALKFWKLIALALVALFSGLKRFFNRKKGTASELASAEEETAMDFEKPLTYEQLTAAEHATETTLVQEPTAEKETVA
ncbi:DUF2167 domain-containing protein [Rufibacter hautae]|uniref:DUF2167 domain-containing protein n=1 Tax=Rufibacter hautae TaxID=2595005 RepID=A0A5B6TG75_9BACT|nr:DUF2167 domain-containing protein [Rufibacter hautae]KAA3438305.1 DUF2167 domain-containing protein [Rufibacter hautae]